MEYLHKHGKDTDKLMIVAINFKMLREQAKATEDHAKKALATIKRSHLGEFGAKTNALQALFVRKHALKLQLFFMVQLRIA